MRRFGVAACALAAWVVTGCGDDDNGNGNGPDNLAPTANFAEPTCNLLTCTFQDASTDQDGTIASRSWTFENGTPAASTGQTQEVTFGGAGTWTVTLTVTDNEGATDDFTREVTVSDSPANTPPVAGFTFQCSSLECTFTNTTTDAEGTFTSLWDFGDGQTSTETSPTHTYTYTELTEVTVTLTATDEGGATDDATATFTVSPPAGLTCDDAACSLVLPEPASVTVTLVSEDCEAQGNTFIILTPVLDTLFTDGCNSPTPGTPEATFPLQGGAVFDANTEITAEVISGLPNQEFAPTVQVSGTYPTWTLRFDDGRGGDNEPDFNDLVLEVVATPSP